MNGIFVELDQVRISVINGEEFKERIEGITRLMFGYVREMIENGLPPGGDIVLDRLEAAPLDVSFDSMDDETIARAGAEGIYRSLIQAID